VSLPALCIRRPVFTVMMCLLPVVIGLFTMLRIGVDLFPNVDLPVVMITTNRPGTSVEEMETGVTKLVEDAVNTISGIDELRSTTTEGRLFVTVQFLLEKDATWPSRKCRARSTRSCRCCRPAPRRRSSTSSTSTRRRC
jgi:HAE1 family hydrophobic/amphiphilic exporter-1